MSKIPENERKQHFHRNGTKRSSETKFTEKEQFDFIFLSKFLKIIRKCLWRCWMNLDNNWSWWQGNRTMFLWKIILLRRFNQQGKKIYISNKQCEKWVSKHVSFEKIMPDQVLCSLGLLVQRRNWLPGWIFLLKLKQWGIALQHVHMKQLLF